MIHFKNNKKENNSIYGLRFISCTFWEEEENIQFYKLLQKKKLSENKISSLTISKILCWLDFY